MHPDAELRAVAKRVVWFKQPDRTLQDDVFFLNHVMVWGDVSDTQCIRRHYSDNQLRQALAHAHPGVFDARSWHYWHIVLGVRPIPPLPRRRLPKKLSKGLAGVPVRSD